MSTQQAFASRPQYIIGKNLSDPSFRYKYAQDTEVRFDNAVKYDVSKAYAGHTAGTAADGGEFVPLPLADYFYDLVEKDVFARQLFAIKPMTSNTLEIPIKSAGLSVYLSGESKDMTTEGGAAGASSSYSKMTFTSTTLTAKKFVVLSGASTELLEDANINFSEAMLQSMARDLAEAEERAFIQGEAAGTSLSWGAGDVRYAFDGLIWHVYGSNVSTGAHWTPDNASPVMWADGGNDVLTSDELNAMDTRIEEQGYRSTHIMMRPSVAGRLRDPTEFEMFQGLKDIGNMAALVKGYVGRYYTADILVSQFMPVGTSSGISGTGSEFVAGTTDSTVLAFDVREPVIGERRKLEARRRHSFYVDVEETRFTERIAFDVPRPLGLAGINDVKNAVA